MGRYPLAPSSTGEVAPADFDAFFKPGGAFWTFYDQQLSRYMSADGRWTPMADAGVPFDPGPMSAMVKKAAEIRDALFRDDPQHASYSFSVVAGPTPEVVVVHELRFGVGATTCKYQMGARVPCPTIWNTSSGEGTTISVAANVDVEQLHAPGPWGLFHAIDRGTISGTASQPRITWWLNAGQKKVRVVWDITPSTAHHPFQRGFFSFSVPAVPAPT
jgi:type VI secretion system protein ImpL